MKMMSKVCTLLLSAVLCVGMAAPAFAYGGDTEEVELPVLTVSTNEEDTVTVTDEDSGALTPEGNLTLVDDYHTSYSDGSGQQFITLVSKSGNTFYLVIDRNSKGENTVHFMNLVDESDLLSLMDDEDAEAYTAEKEAAAQAELERKQAEEEAKKAEEAAASGAEQPKENKVTKYAATFLGVLALVGLAAGGGIYAFMKQKQKKQAEKEALDPDANYTEDKGDFEIPTDMPDRVACIRLIEEFLLSRLYAFPEYNLKRVSTVLEAVNLHPHIRTVQLADVACLSNKQFGRVFAEYVGATPKEFLRIVRIQRALYTLQCQPGISFAQLAYECGFFDQSHMIKEFKFFSGYTPAEYLAVCAPYSDYFFVEE
mgnify:CR=1 FL=1